MHKSHSTIAAIALNSQGCWEVVFSPHAVVTLKDIVSIYHYTQSRLAVHPILMDWRSIQGIEFEALEHIARTQNQDFPLAIVSETGSIGEKYAHLIGQLCEQGTCCTVFSSINEARSRLIRYRQLEA